MRTCRPVGPVRLFADCRNAAQCESLGHRPRNRFISNTNALKGQNWGRASSFRPVGAVCVSNHFSQGDALGFRIWGLWPGTHSAPQCPKLSRPLTANAIQLGCGRSQGQRTLNSFDTKDLHQEVIIPATDSAFHSEAVLAGMLCQQGQSEASEPCKILSNPIYDRSIFRLRCVVR